MMVLLRRIILSFWSKTEKFLGVKCSSALTRQGPHAADTLSGNQVTQFDCTKVMDAV